MTALSKKLVGLTGGIASGKSTVAKLFCEQGIPVIDADQLARKLREPGGPAHPLLLKRFGTDDPKELRELIFKDPAAKADLEKLLHPLILQASEAAAQVASAENPTAPFILYEAALLVETGRNKALAALVVVDAPVALRKARLITRDGILAALADQMIQGQTTDEIRNQAATFVLTNQDSPEKLRSEVITLIEKLTLYITKIE